MSPSGGAGGGGGGGSPSAFAGPFFQSREELLARLRMENAHFDAQIDLALLSFNALGLEIGGAFRWNDLKNKQDYDVRSAGAIIEFEYVKGYLIRELPLRFQNEDHSMHSDWNESGLLRGIGDDFMEASSRLMNGAKSKLFALLNNTVGGADNINAGMIGTPYNSPYDDPTERFFRPQCW